MKHGFDLTKGVVGKEFVEHVLVEVVGNLQVGNVAELIALGQVIDRDDVVDASSV